MTIDRVIIQTENFMISTINPPHISREDGGHIVIVCKKNSINEYEDMSDSLALELSVLARIAGKGLKKALAKDNIDVGIINYQINGNWSICSEIKDPLHLHVYGRAKCSDKQRYGEALYLPKPLTGFYKNNKGLSNVDISLIRDYFLCKIERRKEINIIDD